jgi:predicted KAP-like P-loop ATPase
MIIKHNSQQSLVIGLYGKWGEGKTSVMNFIKTELPPETVVINFNPWLFSDQNHLIKSFFDSIAFELNRSLTNTKEKVGKLLSDYGSAIGMVTQLAGVSLNSLNVFGDKLKNVSIEKLKERVDKIINESGKRIVVCIDDIDRLDIIEVQSIFKLVKLVGDFPNTSYILAFDDEMVSAALAPKYGSTDKNNGYLFLEKIVQIPLKIPKATKKALRQYTVDLIDKVLKDYEVKLEEKEVEIFMTGFEDCFVPNIDNPRLGIRYANTLSFALPLMMGEVHTGDLMLIEGIKIFFPEAYDFIRGHSSLFLTDTSKGGSMSNDLTKDQIKKRIEEFLTKYPEEKRKHLLSLIQELFPQVLYVYRNFMLGDKAWRDWYQNKRIASGKYFNRYFTYAVQEDEISDVFFTQLLTGLEKFEELDNEVEELFATVNSADIVFKLRLWEERLTSNQSKALAKLMIKQSRQFPVEEGEFSSFTTYAEAAKMISHLILNIPLEERLEYTLGILRECDDVKFAMEVAYWLFYKNEKEEKKLLDINDTKKLQQYLIDKFKDNLDSQNLFDILPDSEFRRLISWGEELNSDEIKDLIKAELKKDESVALRIIKLFTPTITSYGNKGTRTFKSGFEILQYNALAAIFDPETLFEALRNSSYEAIDVPSETNSGHNALTDDELAGIFMKIHEEQRNGLTAE